MQNQLAKLVRTNQHLQITSSSFKSETNQLLAEHRHLQNTLQEKDRQIISIRDKISLSEKSQQQDSVSLIGRTRYSCPIRVTVSQNYSHQVSFSRFFPETLRESLLNTTKF